jgi:GDP/UDP-N,N'-diacetylbacillosamine 2-epimerase (hydrolysing)
MKVCVMTGSRAEYGLLFPLLKAIGKDQRLKLQILVTGMHLSPQFGNTYKIIEQDGFSIDEKVEILLAGDSKTEIVKSMGLGLLGFSDSIRRLAPDWVVILGDRFEAFSFATAAYMQGIPIAHLHGGEVTEGANDDGLRHAITKLSFLHFTSTEIYKKRVIQLGEESARVYNVGALSIDNIKSLKLLNREELEKSLRIQLHEKFLLVTYHPVTLDSRPSEQLFKELLDALDCLEGFQIIFTLPNADAGNTSIIEMIYKFVKDHNERAKAFTTLGQVRYLSTLKYSYAVVGNSSSGIVEAPALGVPTINIGDRQLGRIMANSIVQALTSKESILDAIKKISNDEFRQSCKQINHPYGDGNTAEKIVGAICGHGKIDSVKKSFIDI